MEQINNFYPSSYSCPVCNQNLLKTVFHRDVTIESGSLKIPVIRVFLCKRCYFLIIPRPGFSIDCLNYYFVQFNTKDSFEDYFSILNSLGSTESISNDPLITRNDFELAANSKMLPTCFLTVSSAYGYTLDSIFSSYNGWIDEIKLPFLINFIDN